ncbi:MAG: pyrroline-5-carboxylate reductase [Syntrophobacteraceae bacterium]
MFEQRSIGFIGGGNMGEALVRGLLGASLFPAEKVYVYDVSPSRTEYLAGKYGIRVGGSVAETVHACDIVVLSVKPQVVPAVLAELGADFSRTPLVVSIAAGITVATIENALPEGAAVVRVMPNTPALVLEGASALSRGKAVSTEQMEMSLALFKAVGKAVEVEEKWMDAVTGLSGSGPAYVLLMIEAMVDGGVLMGIPRNIARELVVQTFVGTSLMLSESGKHSAEMKDMITSPGGTTIQGLKVLEAKGVRGALFEAVEAAAKRSEELGKH